MNLGYVIIYVPSVEDALSFYEKAFGFTRAFITDTGEYGEALTGQTKLAFAQREFAIGLSGLPFVPTGLEQPVVPVELGFVTDDVETLYHQALSAGATDVKAPSLKPWGQTVAYVRDLNGYLVEICTEMKS